MQTGDGTLLIGRVRLRYLKDRIILKMITNLTEFRHQMRSGDLLAYLSLNCPSSGIVSCS